MSHEQTYGARQMSIDHDSIIKFWECVVAHSSSLPVCRKLIRCHTHKDLAVDQAAVRITTRPLQSPNGTHTSNAVEPTILATTCSERFDLIFASRSMMTSRMTSVGEEQK